MCVWRARPRERAGRPCPIAGCLPRCCLHRGRCHRDASDHRCRVFRQGRSDNGGNKEPSGALAGELDRPIHVTLRKTRIRRRWQLWCAIQSSNRWLETYACDVPGTTTVHLRLLSHNTLRPARTRAMPIAIARRTSVFEVAWQRSPGCSRRAARARPFSIRMTTSPNRPPRAASGTCR